LRSVLALSADGLTLAVGGMNDENIGSVFVFRSSDEEWVEVQVRRSI
jgi:hypothetical protein